MCDAIAIIANIRFGRMFMNINVKGKSQMFVFLFPYQNGSPFQFLPPARYVKIPANHTLETSDNITTKKAFTNLHFNILSGRIAAGPFCKNLQIP